VCFNLRETSASWQFRGPSDVNLGVVALQRRQSEGGINIRGKCRIGIPSVTEETVERLREKFFRSSRKSVSRASRKLGKYGEENCKEKLAVVIIQFAVNTETEAQ
jgi:hypothetical protein